MPPAPLVQKPQASRYRRGKLPQGAPAPSDSDESSGEEEDDDDAPPKPKFRQPARAPVDENVVAGGAGRVIQTGAAGKGRNIQVALRDVKVDEEGLLIGGKREVGRTVEEEESSAEETDDEEEESEEEAPARPVFRRPGAASRAQKKEESESEEETDSEEESSEEEEEEPPKPMYRPTFVPKRARETVQVAQEQARAEEEAFKRKEQELQERKKESRSLVGETIRREMAAKEAEAHAPDVDDTDDLDPPAEFDAWRLRELSRLARDKEAANAREEERIEVERRRAMPEAERLREDEEHARRVREEKMMSRGERGFLERYHHKGAFHQDDDIVRRNVNTKLESSVDMSMLPKVLQVKNFGKASRTKYTHLKDQDTTQEGWDRALKKGPGGVGGGMQEGCFNCGGPHLKRDCPNNNLSSQGGPSGTGANSSALGTGLAGPSGPRNGYDSRGAGGWGNRQGSERVGNGERERDQGRRASPVYDRGGGGRDAGYDDRRGDKDRERSYRSRDDHRSERREEREDDRRGDRGGRRERSRSQGRYRDERDRDRRR